MNDKWIHFRDRHDSLKWLFRPHSLQVGESVVAHSLRENEKRPFDLAFTRNASRAYIFYAFTCFRMIFSAKRQALSSHGDGGRRLMKIARTLV